MPTIVLRHFPPKKKPIVKIRYNGCTFGYWTPPRKYWVKAFYNKYGKRVKGHWRGGHTLAENILKWSGVEGREVK
jgi:hypothetical protein